ncbi:MAG: DUF1925 domain-containing protein [Candidatus Lokiarchaeota archaeon]|nr:DUF1925 domain-containing protein [Candidatus Lokiarchaeota archaeon]
MVFHFHQPVDNFEHVIEDCYRKSYGPLINTIYDHPSVKVTLHFSGNLLEWFIENKPKLVNKLKQMAKRNQIEIIGGGFYEPIYAIIPTRDKITQMRKLSHLVEQEFGITPKGAWLSERVWEPSYPSFLAEVGLKYVIVDDNHFRSSGISEEDTFYSYVTEDEGKTLRVFPINEQIRYLTPWKPTHETIDYLRSVADEKGDRFALLISDAEKMGVWGSTHQICYIEGYGHQEGDNGRPFLPSLFKQVEDNDWIKSITLFEYMWKHPAKDLVYLPTSSYDKMEEWVLPTPMRKKFQKIVEHTKKYKTWHEAYQFLKGGFWRSFLVKYPESNNMHKKMLHVREKLLEVESKIKKIKDGELVSILKPKVLESWDEIYKSQCNDCYWHGLFGGVYLQFLRFSVYTHLINAEKLIDEMNGLLVAQQGSFMWLDPMDFTRNSKSDVLIESDLLNVYVNPSDAGTIFELDFKPKSYNLLNTLTRWPEAYHNDDKIKSGEINNDRFRRSMLRLRFLHDDVRFEQLIADNYYEFGDFVNNEFKIKESSVKNKVAELLLEVEGSVKDTTSDYRIPCRVIKKISVKGTQIDININGQFEAEKGQEEALKRISRDLNLAIDIPFFFNGDPKEFRFESKDLKENIDLSTGNLKPFRFRGSHFKAYDKSYDLTFEIKITDNSQDIQFNAFPIVAYVFTDEGYQEIYQGINITPLLKFESTFQLNLCLKIY